MADSNKIKKKVTFAPNVVKSDDLSVPSCDNIKSEEINVSLPLCDKVKSNNTKPFLINIALADMTAKGHIYNSFDYDCVKELYDKMIDGTDIPIIYHFLYKYINQMKQQSPIVTYSPDQSISAATIAGLSEKYMFTTSEDERIVYKSKLKVIYLTSKPHVQTNLEPLSMETCSNCILSNLMCLTDFTFTKHKMMFDPDQCILMGLNDDLLTEYDNETLLKLDIPFFTLNRMNKVGLKKIIDSVMDSVGDNPVHIIFDMSVMDTLAAPCVTRFLDKTEHLKIRGLSLDHIDILFDHFSRLNIVGVDVTSYDLRYNPNEIAYRVTCETARKPLIKLLGFKQKSINIFNEHTRFLIWRPRYQKSPEDIGWFILRGMSLAERESILASLGEDDIKIISIDNTDKSVDDDEDEIYVYVTSTTMAEQEQKSYLLAESINDCALFYEEKVHMMFEMLNSTPS